MFAKLLEKWQTSVIIMLLVCILVTFVIVLHIAYWLVITPCAASLSEVCPSA